MNIFHDYLREKSLEFNSGFKMCNLTTLLYTLYAASEFFFIGHHTINMHTNINIY